MEIVYHTRGGRRSGEKSLQSSVGSLQPILPRAERMSDKAGGRLFYKSYKSYKSYILGVADKPDPEKHAYSVRQAHGSAA